MGDIGDHPTEDSQEDDEKADGSGTPSPTPARLKHESQALIDCVIEMGLSYVSGIIYLGSQHEANLLRLRQQFTKRD